MRPLPRCVLTLPYVFLCAASTFAQQPAAADNPQIVMRNDSLSLNLPEAPLASGGGYKPPVAPAATGGNWLFRRFSIGTYSSTLGFGGRMATSITHGINLRAGVTYLNFSVDRSAYGIPYNANLILQSEQAAVDLYPFRHSTFHVSPGWFFASSNRAFGSAYVPSGIALTLNGMNYYSSATNPIHASGYIGFSRSAPMVTMGWGNWIRHMTEGGHWAFPFEFGMAFEHDPKTGLDFTGDACASNGRNCINVISDPGFQANLDVERKRLQNDADWARFYPIFGGGIVYRF
jgi:hypothetical protein